MRRTSAVRLAAAALVAAWTPAHAERVLRAEVVVNALPAEVWAAWTTEAGIATFFAPAGKVDLRVDGTYDIWFLPDNPPGQRGAEGMRILDVEPNERFAFTWDAPPSIPRIRNKRTMVIVELAPEGTASTRVRFTHLGWGSGPDWDKAYDYFAEAWGGTVLPRLIHRFANGPIDWAKRTELAPLTVSMKQELAPAQG